MSDLNASKTLNWKPGPANNEGKHTEWPKRRQRILVDINHALVDARFEGRRYAWMTLTFFAGAAFLWQDVIRWVPIDEIDPALTRRRRRSSGRS